MKIFIVRCVYFM